jgi:hypothetical protein
MSRKILLGSVLGLSMGIGAAGAATLSLDFNASDEIEPTGPPGQIAGDLNLQFTDVPGGVEMTLTNHVTSGQTLDKLFFNFNPEKNFPFPYVDWGGNRFWGSGEILDFTSEPDVSADIYISNKGIQSAGTFDIYDWSRSSY